MKHNLKKDIEPFLRVENTNTEIIFKCGFLACIKSLEDKGEYELAKRLEIELLVI